MIEVKITYEVFSKDGFSICSCAVLSGAEEIPDFVGNKNSIKIKGNFPVSKNVNLKVDGRWENTRLVSLHLSLIPLKRLYQRQLMAL